MWRNYRISPLDPNVYLRASLQVLAIHLSYFKVLNPLIRVTTGYRRVTRIIDAMHNMLPSAQRALRLFQGDYFRSEILLEASETFLPL